MLNKKIKLPRIFKKFVLLTLASTIGLSSGAVFTSLVNPIQGQTSAAGVLKTRYDWQTQYLVDVNNMILPNCVMHSKMNYSDDTHVFPKSVDLTFDLKGYDTSKLNFRIFQKAQAEPEYKDYVLDSETQKINLTVTNGANAGDVERWKVYEVDVYNGNISKENLIGKGTFLVVSDYHFWNDRVFQSTKFPLIDANGNPVIYRGNEITDLDDSVILRPGNQVFLTFAKSSIVNDKAMCSLPTELFPFDARSIKVVAFASNPDYRYYRTINIDKYMYPSYQNDCIQLEGTMYIRGSSAPYLIWAPDIMDFKEVNGEPVKFEFHFYKDNVLRENFLFKAVDVTLT